LQELWEYRELLYFFVWRDVKIRYEQKTAIGVLWVVLQLVLTVLVATLLFGKLAATFTGAAVFGFLFCCGCSVDLFSNSIGGRD
jgi:ABC-type polysaccharide/polyol phosphate export permease